MPVAIYEQRSGRFVVCHDNDPGEQKPPIAVFFGYAGTGDGRNNPAYQRVRATGPLPCGFYTISRPYHHPRLGPVCMRLEPDASNDMFGRSAFRIHGDNARNDASEGCIVLPRAAREFIAAAGVKRLRVVRGLTHLCNVPAGCAA